MFNFEEVQKMVSPVLKQIPGLAEMNCKEVSTLAKDVLEGVKKTASISSCNIKIKQEEAKILKDKFDIGELIIKKGIKINDKDINAILKKVKASNTEIASQKLTIKMLEKKAKGSDIMNDITSLTNKNKEYFEKNFKMGKTATKKSTTKKTTKK